MNEAKIVCDNDKVVDMVHLKQQSIEKYLLAGYKADDPDYSSPPLYILKNPRHLSIPFVLSGIVGVNGHTNFTLSNISSKSCGQLISPSDIRFQGVTSCNSTRVGVSIIRFENGGIDGSISPSLFAVAGSNGIIRIFDMDECMGKIQRRDHCREVEAKVIINTRKDISDLRWSHRDIDEIAVCFSFQVMIHIYNLNKPEQPKFVLELGRDFCKGGGHNVMKYLPIAWWETSVNNINNSTGHSNSNNPNKRNKTEYVIAGGADGCIRLWSYPERPKKVLWEISNTQSSAANVPIIDIEVVTLNRGFIVSINQCGVLCIFDIFLLERLFSVEAPKCLKRLMVFESFLQPNGSNIIANGFKPPLITAMRWTDKSFQNVYIFTRNGQSYRFNLTGMIPELKSSSSSQLPNQQSSLLPLSLGPENNKTINYGNKQHSLHNISSNNSKRFNSNYTTTNISNKATTTGATIISIKGRLELNESDICLTNTVPSRKRTIVQAEESSTSLSTVAEQYLTASVCRSLCANWLPGYVFAGVHGTGTFQIVNINRFHSCNSLNQPRENQNTNRLVVTEKNVFNSTNSMNTNNATTAITSNAVPTTNSNPTCSSSQTNTDLTSSQSNHSHSALRLSNNTTHIKSNKTNIPQFKKTDNHNSLTLPGRIITAEQGNNQVTVSHNLHDYLHGGSSSSASQSHINYSKSNIIYFDWSLYSQRSSFDSNNNLDDENKSISKSNKEIVGIDSNTAGWEGAIEQVWSHTLILKEPYIGPTVNQGSPRVRLCTNLIPTQYDVGKSISTSISRNVGRVLKEVRLNSAVTAIECHPILPYILVGTFDDNIQILDTEVDGDD